jgi:lambda family phage portal protein
MTGPRVKPTITDRAVALVSPATGLKRLHARAAWQTVTRSAFTGTSGPVISRGGQKKGTLFNWVVNKLNRWNEAQERETVSDRAEDLTANHPHATSCIESMSTNIIGTGLNPQAKPRWKRLGISEEQAGIFAESAEWVWANWCRRADIGDRLHFQDIQYLAAYSMLVAGEYLILPTMRKYPTRPGDSEVRMALQVLSPHRMATPMDMVHNPAVRDGVVLGSNGEPTGHYVATPKTGRLSLYMTSADFTLYPAWIGHRPGMFHSFHAAAKHPDRVRGVSVLAPAMKFFRDLSDYLDFELVGAIVASSFPLFIETSNPYDTVAGFPQENPGTDDTTRYQEVEPGQVMYGSANQKPHVLKNERPGNTFEGFVETILRAVGASVGMPYEVVAKDFSKTNYSSARAALLEAWRVYQLYRVWMERHLCQPVWKMVMEEAWLRGELALPKGGPDFYEAMAEYTYATWIGPARGHVDPVKEMKANIEGLNNNILTLSDLAAEQGKDWETQVEQRGRETRKVTDEGLTAPDAEDLPDNDDENEDLEGGVNGQETE